jgi:hypothetical protein
VSARPLFAPLWHHFLVIYGDGTVRAVGQKIAGKVGENIKLGETDPKAGFTNALRHPNELCTQPCGCPDCTGGMEHGVRR